MANISLYETKLLYTYSCRSMWPHCNTVYCRWGRYGTTDITNTNATATTRVSQGSHTFHKTQGNGLSIEKQGNLREFTKHPREFFRIAKSQDILREWLWQIQVLLLTMLRCFFTCFAFSFQKHWKNKPFINSPSVNICNIYLPIVKWWMAYIHPNNGVHIPFMKILMLWT